MAPKRGSFGNAGKPVLQSAEKMLPFHFAQGSHGRASLQHLVPPKGIQGVLGAELFGPDPLQRFALQVVGGEAIQLQGFRLPGLRILPLSPEPQAKPG